MANSLENAIARTRVLAGLAKGRGLDDSQLLRQFVDGDESAFTILVERHGGLVMGVCRRILQHTQDAEDAFQATFLVLAKKAGRIAWQESIANWLHGVACRIAFQVRREKIRHAAEAIREPAVNGPDPAWSELKPALDEELDRLPARYRAPLVLCCLEGKTRDEAAALLGWSIGSVKGRLERGREMLRSRSARRGLALSAAFASLMLAGGSTDAAVPLTLSLTTVRAGMALLAGETSLVSASTLTLAQGAIHAMFMTKLKIAAAVAFAVLTIGLGGSYLTHQALAGAGNADPPRKETPTGTASTQDRDPVGQRGEREVGNFHNGVVTDIDAAKKTITFRTGGRGEAPGSQSFDLAKDVKVVFRTGRKTREGKLADVPLKTAIRAKLDDAKKTVVAIEITVPTTVSGTVTEIGADSITLGSGGRGSDVKTTTYSLAKDLKIQYRLPAAPGEARGDAKLVEMKLADLAVKTAVSLQLDDDLKIVQSIGVHLATMNGTLQDVDAKKLTLLLRPGRGDDVMLNIAKDAKVIVKGKAGNLSDIAVGSDAHLVLSPDRTRVLFLQTPPPQGRE